MIKLTQKMLEFKCLGNTEWFKNQWLDHPVFIIYVITHYTKLNLEQLERYSMDDLLQLSINCGMIK